MRVYKTNAATISLCIFAGGTLSFIPAWLLGQSEWYREFYERHIPFAGVSDIDTSAGISAASALALLLWSLVFAKKQPDLALLAFLISFAWLIIGLFMPAFA